MSSMKGCSSLAVSLGLFLSFNALAVTPIIKTQPADCTNTVASAATFTVLATNTSPIAFQWQFNSNNIAGATNATLWLDNVQVSQMGYYRVQVISPTASVFSRNAKLT